ncbi:hypothetical protein [Desulfatibacillum aliphaticivorans]|uniref:hypothetical protein n=1 Tax=Desulfatibacillum aliphaticivorans TaxID=218208 RepID=UPI000417FD36|nr:hypothetical protein [Desulfatibacillum aliphaticivorans]
MKHGVRPNTLILFVLCFFLCITDSSFANDGYTVYDDFNGSAVSDDLWRGEYDPPTAAQSNGVLVISNYVQGGNGWLSSKQTFAGDFDFVCRYQNMSFTPDEENGYPHVTLQVSPSRDGSSYLWIYRGQGGVLGYDGPQHSYQTGGSINGTGVGHSGVLANNSAGAMRITRKGSTITTYYSAGDAWAVLGTYNNAFVSDAVVLIAYNTGSLSPGDFFAEVDWIKFADEIVAYTPLGDLDDNGLVQAEDANLALQLLGGLSPTELVNDISDPAADTNGDGKFDLFDALYILRSVHGIVSSDNFQGMYDVYTAGDPNIQDGVTLETEEVDVYFHRTGGNRLLSSISGAGGSFDVPLVFSGNVARLESSPYVMDDQNVLEFIALSNGVNRAYAFVGQELYDALDVSFKVSAGDDDAPSVPVTDFIGTWTIEGQYDPNLRDASDGFSALDHSAVIYQDNEGHLQLALERELFKLNVSGGELQLADPPQASYTHQAIYQDIKIRYENGGVSVYSVATELDDASDVSIYIGLGSKDTESDSDMDGMRDSWEIGYFGDLSHTGGADGDNDTFLDVEEFVNGTNPTVSNAVDFAGSLTFDTVGDPNISDGVTLGADSVSMTITKNSAQSYTASVSGLNLSMSAKGGIARLVNPPAPQGDFNVLDFVIVSDGGALASCFVGQEADDSTDISFDVGLDRISADAVTTDDAAGDWTYTGLYDPNLGNTSDQFASTSGAVSISKISATSIQVEYLGETFTLTGGANEFALSGAPVSKPAQSAVYHDMRILFDSADSFSVYVVAVESDDATDVSMLVATGKR